MEEKLDLPPPVLLPKPRWLAVSSWRWTN